MRVFALCTPRECIYTPVALTSSLSLTTILKVVVSNSQKQSVSNAFNYVVLPHFIAATLQK